MASLAEQWKNYLRSSPYGVGYSGPDGDDVDDALASAIARLEGKLARKRKDSSLFYSIISGKDIKKSPTQFDALMKGEGEEAEEETADDVSPTTPPSSDIHIVWKKYLNSIGQYSKEDLDDPNPNPQIMSKMKLLEDYIAKYVPSAKGMIVVNNQIDPKITPDEYNKAVQLIKKHKDIFKSAQAKLDEIGPVDQQTVHPPFSLLPSDTQTQLETGNLSTTQSQGHPYNKAPKKSKIEELVNLYKFTLDPYSQVIEGVKGKTDPHDGIDRRIQEIVDLIRKEQAKKDQQSGNIES